MARRLGPKQGHNVEVMLHEQLLRWLAKNHCICDKDIPTKVWNAAWRAVTQAYYERIPVQKILSNVGFMIDRELTK